MQAPSKPSTPFGKMLAYYLQMEPRLFETAVNDQFEQLKSQRERREAGEASASEAEASASEAEAPSSEGNLTLSGLSSRIQEVQEKERRATVEDLMYMCAPCPPRLPRRGRVHAAVPRFALRPCVRQFKWT